jgi:hypothetical protein
LYDYNEGGLTLSNDFYRKIGSAFLFAAALLYTVERIGNKIVYGIESNAGHGTSIPFVTNFFENVFVPAFTLIGVILFVYGFPRKNENS